MKAKQSLHGCWLVSKLVIFLNAGISARVYVYYIYMVSDC